MFPSACNTDAYPVVGVDNKVGCTSAGADIHIGQAAASSTQEYTCAGANQATTSFHQTDFWSEPPPIYWCDDGMSRPPMSADQACVPLPVKSEALLDPLAANPIIELVGTRESVGTRRRISSSLSPLGEPVKEDEDVSQRRRPSTRRRPIKSYVETVDIDCPTGTRAARRHGRQAARPNTVGQLHQVDRQRQEREYVKRELHRDTVYVLSGNDVKHPSFVSMFTELSTFKTYDLPQFNKLPVGNDTFMPTSCGVQDANRLCFYNAYTPSKDLLDHATSMVNSNAEFTPPPGHTDTLTQFNSQSLYMRVLTVVATIVNRILIHAGVQALVFVKKEVKDSEAFIIFTKQYVNTPPHMSTGRYFAYQINTDGRALPIPRPDLARLDFQRTIVESNLYLVGIHDVMQVAAAFPQFYRYTHDHVYVQLAQRLNKIDRTLVYNLVSYICSSYSENHVDPVQVFMGRSYLNEYSDDAAHRLFVEQFAVMIWHMAANVAQQKWLAHAHVHHVHYREDTKQTKSNKVFYYRNAIDYVCDMSTVNDMFLYSTGGFFDERTHVDFTCFYDCIDIAASKVTDWTTPLQVVLENFVAAGYVLEKSITTANVRLTKQILASGVLPDDGFYDGVKLTANDMAVDNKIRGFLLHHRRLNAQPKQKTTSRQREGELMVKARELEQRRINESYDSDYETSVEVPRVCRWGQTATVSIGGKTVSNIPIGVGPSDVTNEALSLNSDWSECMCTVIIDRKGKNLRQYKGTPNHSDVNIEDRVVRLYAVKYTGPNCFTVIPYVVIVFQSVGLTTVDASFVDSIRDYVPTSMERDIAALLNRPDTLYRGPVDGRFMETPSHYLLRNTVPSVGQSSQQQYQQATANATNQFLMDCIVPSPLSDDILSEFQVTAQQYQADARYVSSQLHEGRDPLRQMYGHINGSCYTDMSRPP